MHTCEKPEQDQGKLLKRSNRKKKNNPWNHRRPGIVLISNRKIKIIIHGILYHIQRNSLHQYSDKISPKCLFVPVLRKNKTTYDGTVTCNLILF